MGDDLTLQQGLQAFNKKNNKYSDKRSISGAGDAFLKCHDIAHIQVKKMMEDYILLPIF